MALTQQEQDQVAKAVASVEEKTAGEIVVRVVPRSDDYVDVRLAVAAIWGLILSESLIWFGPESWVSYGVTTAILGGLCAWFLTAIPFLLRRLIPRARVANAVHLRAKAAFVEERVHRTRDASGVLVLVSMLEHRVEILADEGIHTRVGTEGWSRHVRTIVEGVRRGALAEGLIEAVKAVGRELEQHFPPRPDDRNELPDRPRVDL
ncbi:MAG: TPM domain-containing protein [Myxococcota bacterium]